MAGDVGETNDIFFKSGEAAVDQEDKIVVPPRKEPEATVLSDLLGAISSYQSKATFVAYKQRSGNKMDKVNEILSLAYIDVFFLS
ncbi:unnamed protein product [Brassica oleracea var. botrytis]|uniref:Uncharacterized protein n=2 Tax=Brassica TaxID=3705 RepID=A0A3P6EG86_BRAOL|nr:unnamed protein product [Brassica napus]VDD38630.1 unnamed protein product [Brassica oleracea]